MNKSVLQTRLHVVNITDQLFQRSKAFRNHLTAHLTDFLELSLGFRHDKPLPGPSGTANQLRERTLEIVEQWNDKFGSTYKQVCHNANDPFLQLHSLHLLCKKPCKPFVTCTQ